MLCAFLMVVVTHDAGEDGKLIKVLSAKGEPSAMVDFEHIPALETRSIGNCRAPWGNGRTCENPQGEPFCTVLPKQMSDPS
jgi:hypothetical protein